jgi:hypothetical protein
MHCWILYKESIMPVNAAVKVWSEETIDQALKRLKRELQKETGQRGLSYFLK